MKRRYILITGLLLAGNMAKAQQPAVVDYLGQFDGEFAPVMIQHQKQLLHYSGNILLDKIVNYGYYRTVAGVKNNAYGAVNGEGKVIAPFKYDEIRIADEKDETYPEKNYCLIITRLDGKYGAVDTLGNVICSPVYSEIDVLTPRLVKVKKDGLWGWVDLKSGKVLQIPKYEEVNRSYVTDNAVEVKLAGKVGMAAEDGNILINPAWASFSSLGGNKGTLFAYTDAKGKTGLMDKSGKVITPTIYEECNQGPAPDLVAVTVAGKTGFVNADGKMIITPRYTGAEPVGKCMKVAVAQKYGMVNAAGKEIIPVLYDDIKTVNDKGEEINGAGVIEAPGYKSKKTEGTLFYFIVTKGQKKALFDETGKQLVPFDYTEISITPYHDMPYLAVQKNGKNGLMGFDGKIILPAEYDGFSMGYHTGYSYQDAEAGEDKQNYVATMKGERIGLFNTATGQVLLPPVYDWIQWQTNGIISLRNGDTTALANPSGKVIRAPRQYGTFTAVDTNRIVETYYTADGHTVSELTDITGNRLYTNPDWEFKEGDYTRLLMPDSCKNGHAQYHDGLLKIWNTQHANVFVDKQGKEVVFDGYSFVGDFWNGLAVAGKEAGPDHMLYGIINREKEAVTPLDMDDIRAFDDDLLLVKKDTMQGLIRKDGSVFIPAKYREIEQTYHVPYYKVFQNDQYGMFDQNGIIILLVVYDAIRYNEAGKVFEVTQNGKKGLADRMGRMIIPAVYDELETNKGSDKSIFPLLVKQDKWYFYLDENGKALPYRSQKEKSYED